MLTNAVEPHAEPLDEIALRAASEWEILGSPEESDFTDDRILYVASYALIRIGNTIAQHSRRLERVYPGYGWVVWVDLRNELAHELGDIDQAKVWQAVSEWLPELLEAITGEQPAPPARRGTIS